jgi:predicted transcriptional regulator
MRLRERHRELKMTSQEVADTAGFLVGFISQIERGITVPSLTSLVAVWGAQSRCRLVLPNPARRHLSSASLRSGSVLH